MFLTDKGNFSAYCRLLSAVLGECLGEVAYRSLDL